LRSLADMSNGAAPPMLAMCGTYAPCTNVDANDTCVSGENRGCVQDLELGSNTDTCGNCLAGYVDISKWNGTTDARGCVPIEDITWDMYERAHNPTYGSTVEYELNETVTSLDEARLQRLHAVLQLVSEARAQIPPLPYALDANKFSADLPPDYAGLAGHNTLRNASSQVGFGRFSNSSRRRRRRMQGSSSDSLPAAVDWVQAGAVTYVKNQVRSSDVTSRVRSLSAKRI
jgi:hypothetical protein